MSAISSFMAKLLHYQKELPVVLKPVYSQVPFDSSKSVTSVDGFDKSSSSFILAYALVATVGFTVAVYLWEGLLDARQRHAYQQTHFPEHLAKTVSRIDQSKDTASSSSNTKSSNKESDDKKESTTKDSDAPDKNKPLLPQLQDKFTKAQAYGLDKINFGMIASTYDTAESVIFLYLGFLPYIWDFSVKLGRDYFGYEEHTNEIKVSLIFLLLTTIIGMVTSLPFELYSTFQIERKHGFNKQTPALFFTDKLKSLFLTMIIGGPFTALLLYIIQKGGPYFYLYVWAFMFCFSVFMMTIVPIFIMPLFNKYEPLPDGPLKTQIYELADQLKYPLTKLFVMDGSKRSSHSNAFMFGFGKNKRIVLFDTLLEQVESPEILAILGHELGHWKLGHTWTNFIVTQLYFGAAFYIFSLVYTNSDLYAAFGFNDATRRPVPAIIALLLFFQTLWAPVDKLLSFGMTIHSRFCEFAADKFSAVDLDMSRDLQSGLCKIHLENLGAMCPDHWYSTYHYSHPPLVERLSAMMELDKKSK